ncbi:MAG: hypothetical protein V1928_03065 [Parcubacteria group bacterium]
MARIIEDEDVKKKLIQRYLILEDKSAQGDFYDQRKISHPLYSFVTLSTVEFEGDIALLHRLSNNTTVVEGVAPCCSLNALDIVELKKAIIDNDGIAKELQDYIKTL